LNSDARWNDSTVVDVAAAVVDVVVVDIVVAAAAALEIPNSRH